jgi:hypothetical protein
VLNTWSKVRGPAFTPVLLNVSFIVGAAFFAERFDPPVLVLAWAVFIGGLLQLAFQLPFLWKIGMLPRWRFDLRHPGVTRVLKADGTGGVRRVGKPDLAPDQHHLRIVPRHRQRVLAVLRRPAHGVSRRASLAWPSEQSFCPACRNIMQAARPRSTASSSIGACA